MSTFSYETPSDTLAALMQPGETWEPIADGRARIHSPFGEPRIAHRHTCLNCERVVGWGDDCEYDTDHDYELCNACA